MVPEAGDTRDEAREAAFLKRERNALILAHSYQPPEIQDAADLVGDSLELSRAAASASQEVIVLCGVRFMAETAAVLSPGKLVLHPVPDAGCPLADCMTAEDLKAMKTAFPDALSVVYINSSMELKAISYACCTSANAVSVVEAVPAREVLFGPDRNLGVFVSGMTGKTMRIFQGCCPPHARADLQDILEKKRDWPDAEVLVHPETPPEAWALADAVLGTGGMLRRVSRSTARRFLIGTEEGFVYRLRKTFPDRSFEPAGRIRCPNMKRIGMPALLSCLRRLEPVVEVPAELAGAARVALERMTDIG